MNNYRNIVAPVKRSGTNQRERLPESLLPGYVLVDERTQDDLLQFVAELAKNLNYFKLDNTLDGSWSDFFPDDPTQELKQSPHYTLMLAFLRLFKLSQDHLNTFTQRHLDFYYQEVLRFTKAKAEPDHVHLIFELAKNVTNYFLKADTLFKAGKDENGKDILYKLMHDTALNQASISEIKTVFLQNKTIEVGLIETIDDQEIETVRELNQVERIHASTYQPQDKISTFGNSEQSIADLGFAIAAPILFMREGERTVTLTIEGTLEGDAYWMDHLPNSYPNPEADEETPENELKPPFILKFSGEKEWIKTQCTASSIVQGEFSKFILTIEAKLDTNIAAIVPYLDKSLEGDFKTAYPMVQVLLNPEGIYPYSILKDFNVVSTEIVVDVKAVKTLILQNDLAKLNANKPFQPFGHQVSVGTNFYIGSNEIFQKNLESVNVHLEWFDLPTDDLSTHYSAYDPVRKNSDFKVEIGILKNKKWIDLKQTVTLFEADANAKKTIQLKQDNIESDEAPEFKKLEPYGNDSVSGFIKLTLQGPDFGHRAYPSLYTKAITALNSDPSIILPNPPYTPTLQSISLDYSARTELVANKEEKPVFHIQPFGWSPQTVLNDTPYLLPNYSGEGNLFIGIENLEPPCALSILFQVIEGSGNSNSPKPEINWAYLYNNEWFPLEGPAILRDSTNQFNSSGLITFSIPKQANRQNQILEKGKHWIKATTQNNSEAACSLSNIKTQAATVIEVIDPQNNSTANEPLPPNSIEKMVDRVSEIKRIKQPYVSIHGKGAETDHAFYRRISERLRHKQRALTIWDYERLTLNQFPTLYSATCYSHASMEKGNDAGQVLLIIIPDLRNNPDMNELQPLTSSGLQDKVKTYLEVIAPPHVQIEVRNPVFEAIQTQFMVKFKAGFNNGYYENKLENELKAFLSPWAYSNGKDINFGGRIYKSSLLSFVEELPYVDYVTFFKMNQTDSDGNVRINIEEAETISPISVLTSAAQHKISVITEEATMCADGIGHMRIEETFITIK